MPNDRSSRRLGLFDQHADVGSPRIAGSTTYDDVAGAYTLIAGGVNMWGPRDEFQFAWTRLRGDFVIEARVDFVGDGVEPHRKAGCMIRPALDSDAPYVDAALHGDGLTALQYRITLGGPSDHVVSSARAADTIRLGRRGGSYTMEASKSGSPAALSEFSGVDLGDEVYVGLFLCSHNPDVIERAIFRDVRVTSGPGHRRRGARS